MIGLVIVAHGGLAQELLAATEHVVGRQNHARAISIEPQDDLRAKQSEINAAVDAVEGGDGVIIATDMFGGTPCNLALGAMRSDNVDVVYGANLPMLVKIAKQRGQAREAAISAGIEAGRKYIDAAQRMLHV